MFSRRLTFSLLGAIIAGSALASTQPYVDGVVMVKVTPGNYIAWSSVPASLGGTVVRTFPALGWEKIALPSTLSVDQALKILKGVGSVSAAEPDYLRQETQFTPSDPDWPLQYGPTQIGCQQAWVNTLGSLTTKIAIVDTGIDSRHPEFAGRVDEVAGSNVVAGNSNPEDDNGHGTHVAGIIGAGIDNGIGIAGVCPNATLMPIKVLDSTGSGSDSQIASGIMVAVNNGANIINASLGGKQFSSLEQDAVDYAWSKGVIFVAAGGNDGRRERYYPASCGNAIGVAATDSTGSLASYSNYGAWFQVAAPGDQIYSTYTGESYQYESGTSMSSPHVAAALGLLKSYSPHANSVQLLDALYAGCQPIGNGVQYGEINVEQSMVALNGITGAATVNPVSASQAQGFLVGGDASSLATIDGNDLTIDTRVLINASQVGAAIVEFRLIPSPSSLTALSATVAASGAAGANLNLYVWDFFHRSWVPFVQTTLPSTASNASTFTIPQPWTRYFRSGEMRLMIQTVLAPTQNNPQPGAFLFNIDQLVIQATSR